MSATVMVSPFLVVPAPEPIVFRGETYSNNANNREFIGLWRKFFSRHGVVRYAIGGYEVINPKFDRMEAREALRRLRAFYIH